MLAATVPWILYIVLLVMVIIGLSLNVVGLPGLWVIVISAIAYAWWFNFQYIGLWSIVALIVLGIIAEVLEFLAGAAGSKQAGGSKRGMIGAIVGGLVGGFVGTPFLPIPVVGTIIGSIAGSFAGAYGVEWMIGKTHAEAAAISYGAAKGRVYGIVVKSTIGCAMAVITAIMGLPVSWFAASLPTPPSTMPSVVEPATTVPVA